MLLKNVRLSFPSLFVATSFSPDQDKKYSCTLIVNKDTPEHKALLAEVQRVATEKWGPKAKDTLVSLKASNKICVRDGAEKAGMDGFGEEVVFMGATSKSRPGVYDRDQTPLTSDDGRPYAGCYANAMVELWAQDNQFGKRVNATLRGIQFAADGEPFGGGGRPAAADEFPKLEEAEPATADAGNWMG